jgi:magnesium-protoporphyrin O-methyltransferase
MPQSCCTADYDRLFNEKAARGDLESYRQHGPQGSTARLIDALREVGVGDATLLDIGGGVGVIQHELLAAGAAASVDVDASHAYLGAAREEALRRGFGDRAAHRYGDFVELAPEIDVADVVTLDRVICCYPDMPALVGASVARARRVYGLVFPVDRWWIRLGARFGNVLARLCCGTFRAHIHPTRAVDALIRSRGFEPAMHHRGLVWQTIVYRRVG